MRRALSVALMLLAPLAQASAQEAGTIAGTVTSDAGAPVQGASVAVAGTGRGTVTGADGRYTVTGVPAGQQLLRVTKIGFNEATQSVAVMAGQTATANVRLASTAVQLEGLVAVGYGTQRKETLTGSVATVTAEDLTEIPSATTSGALVGKVPGVLTRQADARPGRGAALQIRNLGRPLYVIDAIPADEAQFNQINVNDIESISVLKDASASAIYGVRASNGVVLVTTKKGRRGQDSRVDVRSYYGVQDMNRFPRPANAVEFVTAQIESDLNVRGRTGWTRSDLEKWKANNEYGYRGFDWYNAMVQRNVPQSFLNASTSGGSESINYYLSVGRYEQDAVWKDFTFERTNVQANIDANITARLKIGAQINGRVQSYINPGVPGGDDYFRPIFGIFRQLPTERPFANDNPLYPALTSDGASNWATLNYDIAGNFYRTNRVGQTNFNVDYDLPVEGLRASARYSYFMDDEMEETFEYTYDLYRYDPATDQYYVAGGNQNPYRDRWNRKLEESVAQLQLNYDRMFGSHEVGVDLAFESSERHRPIFQARSQPATNDIRLMNFNELRSMVHSEAEEARMGYVFRSNYNYDDRYLLEFAGRYDASWRFAPGKRWGLFPSASAGWRVSNEEFYQNSGLSSVLSDLKVRASYGSLGDDDPAILGIGPFDYLEGYAYRQGSSVFDGAVVTGARPRGIPVDNISWIRSTMGNVGLDFGMLDNALTGTVDGFYRRRTGLPAARYDVLVPAEIAITLPNENLNADAHMGVEGSLAWSSTIGSEFNYSLGGNATFSRRRDLYSYKPRFANSWDEYRNSNEDRWSFINWGYQVIGQFQSQDEINGYSIDNDGRNNTTMLPGDFKYRDVNGDGIINSLDERPIGFLGGNNLPYLSFGLNGSMGFRGIDFSMNWAGAGFQSFERNNELKIPFQNNANSPAYIFEDRWRRADPFDLNSAWIPGQYPLPRKGDPGHNNMRKSDFWVTNVRYLRLESIELGYSLPASLLARMKLDNARIFLNGYNVFSIDNTEVFGIDPELASSNGLQYPQMRTLNVGASLGL